MELRVMSGSTTGRAARARAATRVVVAAGIVALTTLTVMGVVLGSGCIFDDGGYDGGGRRIGAPIETNSAPTATVPSPDSGSSGTSGTSGTTLLPDTGAPDV
jgi:hypothetical protein